MRAAAVILAASDSFDAGSARLPCGRSLPRRAADTAWDAGVSAVVVVLGAHARAVADSLAARRPVELIVNEHWQLGHGGSIALGVQAVDRVGVDAVLLIHAERGTLTSDTLRALLETTASHGAAAAPNGSPACLTRKHFRALRALEAHADAHSVLRAALQL